jgi:hypothetical protein
MHPLPNAYADLPRLQAFAAALKITIEAANQAFAQYVPRDAIEADMVEQILLARARITAATARVLAPDIAPHVAARIDRGINTTTRELRALLERLEFRQNRPTWNLPQQYWRPEPIRTVGPVMDESVPDPQPAQEYNPDPEPAAPPPLKPQPIMVTASRWTDTPAQDGDALARFASMRLTPDQKVDEAWMIASREAGQGAVNRKLRRAQERQRAA